MLTRSGVALLVLAPVLLLAGWIVDYPELVVLGLACLLAVLVAAIWMVLQPNLVGVRDIDPSRVAQGEGARAVLTVRNRSRRRSPPILASESVGDRQVIVPLPTLAAGAEHTTAYHLPTSRRGVFDVGPLTIGHSDPLRLMTIGRRHSTLSTLYVHPRLHTVLPLPTGRNEDMDGPTSNSSPRGGIAFHSLREYELGDDLRLVHWKSYAKTGTLMVRNNVVPNEPKMWVVLDTRADSYTETDAAARRDRDDAESSFEDAVRAAGSLALAAYTHDFPLEVITTGGFRAAASRSAGDFGEVLDLLAAVQVGEDDPGLRALTSLPVTEDGIALGVVTGQPDADQTGAVALVRPRFQMVSVVQVGERFGRPAPHIGGAFCINVATSEEFAMAWNRRVLR
ncbi:MAG: DUF58 domain-containing protein [Kineosporiaceae bacterium]